MKRALTVSLCLLAAAGAFAQAPPTGLTAQSVLVMDMNTGQVLYEMNADTRRFPASTTKIMTAMLLLEYLRPEEMLVAPANIKSVTGSSMYLQPGEKVSAKSLLKAIMLRSANDGCHMAAVRMGGSLTGFARMMNAKAKQLGCENTNFVTPHGLPNEGHYTTARDLSKMAIAAMKDPAFREVVRMQSAPISRSMNTQFSVMENRNKFLAEDSRAIGIKTGYTRAAMECFVGAVEQKGTTILTVILKSDKWIEDQRILTRWVDSNFSIQSFSGQAFESKIENGWADTVEVVPDPSFQLLAANAEMPRLAFQAGEPLKAPIKEGDATGQVATFTQHDGSTIEVPLFAGADVEEKPALVAAMMTPWPYTGLGLTALVGYAAARGYRTRKRRRVPRGYRQTIHINRRP